MLALVPLSIILNKAKEGHSLGKDRAKLNLVCLFVNLFLFDSCLAIHIYIYTTNLNRIYK